MDLKYIPYFFNLQVVLGKEKREKLEKYSKKCHFIVKGCQIAKFCETVELWKSLESSSKKGSFFMKYFNKSHISSGKMTIPKMTM